MPEVVKVTTDTSGSSLREVITEFELEPESDLQPIVLIADSFNRVMCLYHGYRPGVVDAIFEILHQIP